MAAFPRPIPAMLLWTFLLLVLFVKSRSEEVDVETCLNNNNDNGDCQYEQPTDTDSVPQLSPPKDDQFIDVTYGQAQHIVSPETLRQLEKAQKYMYKQVLYNETLTNAREGGCKLQHDQCAYWASIGECDKNPTYMRISCAPVCFTCHELDFSTRCPIPYNLQEQNIFAPGDVHKLFTRIVETYDKVTVVSQPDENADAPWVVYIDDFLNTRECLILQELGHTREFVRSMGSSGELNEDGTVGDVESSARTSSQTWCQDSCYENATAQAILGKIERLTGVPDANHEYLQLLQYEQGQYYKTHHDYIPIHRDRASGPRILTVFLYLNNVEAGGGTRFPDLKATVMPKMGRALIWPSVTDEDPSAVDGRTVHEALPVEKGVKFSANSWLHLRDFKTPYQSNCI